MKPSETILISISSLEPRATLAGDIMLRIEKTQRREAQVGTAVFGVLTAVWSVGSVLVINDAMGELANSGFYEYLALIGSDGDTLLVYWKELLLTLVESMPLLQITVGLLCVGALVASLGTFVKDAKYVVFHHRFA